jgi:predicted  nucleic acid-binding Zn-ribbon protein
MDKIKSNFIIAIVALVVLCIILVSYAAGLNGQLGAEKTKVMQLNDQIAGLNAKTSELQAQLSSLTAQAGSQTNLVNSLQNSLNAANTELDNLRAAYTGLELKLKEKIAAEALHPAAIEAVPAK